jgi:hypothetical protein
MSARVPPLRATAIRIDAAGAPGARAIGCGRMQVRWLDRITPTAVLLVSRGWVIDEVARVPDLHAHERDRLVEELIAYEPPRRHGLRNNFIVWLTLITLSWLASRVGLPAWVGFAAGLLILIAVARALAAGALRWYLRKRVTELRAGAGAAPDEPR